MVYTLVITISRQDGSLGDEIASKLSKTHNMKLIMRSQAISEWMPEIADNHQLHMLVESTKFYLNTSSSGISYKQFLESKLLNAAEVEESIVVGMGSQIIFSNNPDSLHIRIIASDKTRIDRISKKYGINEIEAEAFIKKSDRKHKRYINTLYNRDWADTTLYHLTLNTDNLEINECVDIIANLIQTRRSIQSTYNINNNALDIRNNELKSPNFKHPAEVEFAKILDMHNISWEYEPKTFPVEWDAEGNVTMAFSPDFYLTKFDTYIEITTMDQKYVTKKNKKIKRLRELYPDININIVYKKDFHSLINRFNPGKGDEY